MKLAIVALGFRIDPPILMNCAANLVVEDPTLLFQTDLVPDGRAVGIYGAAVPDGTRQHTTQQKKPRRSHSRSKSTLSACPTMTLRTLTSPLPYYPCPSDAAVLARGGGSAGVYRVLGGGGDGRGVCTFLCSTA